MLGLGKQVKLAVLSAQIQKTAGYSFVFAASQNVLSPSFSCPGYYRERSSQGYLLWTALELGEMDANRPWSNRAPKKQSCWEEAPDCVTDPDGLLMAETFYKNNLLLAEDAF